VLWCIDSQKAGEFTQMGTPLVTKISWITWCYPGMTEETFYREFEAFWTQHKKSNPDLKPFNIEIKPDYHFIRPWETDRNHPAVQEIITTYNEYVGEPPSVGGAPLSCDLAHYGDTGRMPCVILGPRGDNLHAPDEWVLLEDIYTLCGIFTLLTVKWCNIGN
jgi:acetylornithine deacetylase/succinyl-diaminopimelate desuccinylase-like protein